MTYLENLYKSKVVPKLVKKFKLKNFLAAPKVLKVVVNMGVGSVQGKEDVKNAEAELAAITGQKPSQRPARLSVAGFGIREGQTVGLKVTLRGTRMYSFLQKLFQVVLPRVRDFRGVSSRSFDNAANYTIGIAEHTVFPEIDLGKITKVRGLEITIVTSTKEKKQAEFLLKNMGMPFKKVKSSKLKVQSARQK